jgi:alkylated DNA repair dioxygenase AlkB
VYSGTAKEALQWTEELLELRELVQKTTGAGFNSCLLNLYHNGEEGLGWHSDNEDELVKNGTIAAISLGLNVGLCSSIEKRRRAFQFCSSKEVC